MAPRTTATLYAVFACERYRAHELCRNSYREICLVMEMPRCHLHLKATVIVGLCASIDWPRLACPTPGCVGRRAGTWTCHRRRQGREEWARHHLVFSLVISRVSITALPSCLLPHLAKLLHETPHLSQWRSGRGYVPKSRPIVACMSYYDEMARRCFQFSTSLA